MPCASRPAKGGVSFIEGMRLLAELSWRISSNEEKTEARSVHGCMLKPARPCARSWLSDCAIPPNWLDGGRRWKTFLGTLRPYQRDGVAWLHFLTGLGLGACLADDMGLGKTIQVLALLLHERRTGPAGGPALLVVPASLLGNWRVRGRTFCPFAAPGFSASAEGIRRAELRIERAIPRRELASADLAVTTYSMLARQAWLTQVPWRLVILDEAQAIKNPSTRQSARSKKLSGRGAIALTGTPVENRLGDLWSLFDFLNPGLLGSAKSVQSFVKVCRRGEATRSRRCGGWWAPTSCGG